MSQESSGGAVSFHDRAVVLGTSRYPRAVLVVVLALLAACAWSSLARYDPVTYRRLTDLKPMALRVNDSFAKEKLDLPMVEEVSLHLDQLYEYEKGKGTGNENMVEQMVLLRQIFDRGVERRRESGPWNAIQVANRKEILAEAFDRAIATEREKNK